MSKRFSEATAVSGSVWTNRWLSYGAVAVLGFSSLGAYLLFFRPLTNKVLSLESDLKGIHQQIVGIGYPENPGTYLEDAQSKLKKMRTLAVELSKQTALSDDIELLLDSSFRVLEFEQRRFDIEQSLIKLAEEQGSSLPNDFLSRMPSYFTTAEEEQQLLWLHLEFFNHVMVALLSSGRELNIEEVESLPVRTLGETSAAEGSLLQIQLHLRVAGNASTLASFLNASLPGSEGADNSSRQKAYDIDRIDLYSAADNEDRQVTLDTQLSGFVFSQLSH